VLAWGGGPARSGQRGGLGAGWLHPDLIAAWWSLGATARWRAKAWAASPASGGPLPCRFCGSGRRVVNRGLGSDGSGLRDPTAETT
jgi:hypothetical protein